LLDTLHEKSSRDVDVTRRMMNYIDVHVEEAPTLDDISAHVALSPFHAQRVFKRVAGVSPRQYAQARRLERFKVHLRDGRGVTAALYDAGYGSSSRAYERAPENMGMTPAVYSRGGAGMFIVYSIVDCALGRLLVATTDRGVCAIHLGDPSKAKAVNDEELEQRLFAEYPLATLQRNVVSMCHWVEEVVTFINESNGLGEALPFLDLPMDIRGTAFQLRVWEALRSIPYGETRTYAEIAREIGHPYAASAVANACDANPVSVIVPCHRAERQDGEVAARYSPRGKAARKLLLTVEREAKGD
jgi:AraC family transcriptional regulator of adaptative response/methylated-DNA-[protein]-cysteine methyltransferase